MHIVLWDTRKNDAAKDFAGGFGVGQYPGRGGLGDRLIRYAFKRDRRPVALNFAYLTSIFRCLGHTVEYAEDRVPGGADLYVFNPALVTLHLERAAMRQALTKNPSCRILVTGLVAHALPEAFDGLDVTILRGEPEQLSWKLDEVLADGRRVIDLGRVAALDTLPFPDWSLFKPGRFRVGYDFSQFPTTLIQLSRGCTFSCNYCPYIILENGVRSRTPEYVVDEMRWGIRRYGFRSFKFRDPLFGVDRQRALQLAQLIGKLPRRVQFSIESRIDLLRPDTLKALREAGLTSVTVGIETPDEEVLRRYQRAPIADDRQREFVTLCRSLGIRTVAGFMIGFPRDTEATIENVLRYAKALNPTFANFNIVTPYPGTEFFRQVKQDIATFDYTRYSVYTPVMKYQHLSSEKVAELHARCFGSFYFRSRWFEANAHLVWPLLARLGLGRKYAVNPPAAAPPPHPLPGNPRLLGSHSKDRAKDHDQQRRASGRQGQQGHGGRRDDAA